VPDISEQLRNVVERARGRKGDIEESDRQNRQVRRTASTHPPHRDDVFEVRVFTFQNGSRVLQFPNASASQSRDTDSLRHFGESPKCRVAR